MRPHGKGVATIQLQTILAGTKVTDFWILEKKKKSGNLDFYARSPDHYMLAIVFIISNTIVISV